MPRKSRKRIVGREEDTERAARELEYSELEDELHVDWQTRTDDEIVSTDSDE